MNPYYAEPELCPVCHKPTMLHEKACDDTAQQAEQQRAREELDRLNARIDAMLTSPSAVCEPGWGVIVEAGVRQHDKRLRWMRLASAGLGWDCEDPFEYVRHWDDLIDPVIVGGIHGGVAS